MIKRLEDAADACERVQRFLRGVTRETFLGSELLRSAVERQLEIIGEALNAAAKEEKSLAERVPELPRIVGLRNRLIHGYDSVDAEIILDIANHNIPPLLEQLHRGVRTFGS